MKGFIIGFVSFSLFLVSKLSRATRGPRCRSLPWAVILPEMNRDKKNLNVTKQTNLDLIGFKEYFLILVNCGKFVPD